MKEDEKQKILKHYDPDVLPIEVAAPIYEEMEGLDPLSKMSNVDIQIWLEGDIYLNVDKMSEAAGLEIRMPLTDRRIFDIASRMPSKYKVNDEQNKVAFRTAAAKVLPEEIAFRKKLGLCLLEFGWQMIVIIRMCVRSSTVRWQRNSSMWTRLTQFLMSM